MEKLYRNLISAGKDITLVAWDYDERLYKKIKFLSKLILEKHGIKPLEMKSEWPHISAAYILAPDMSAEERNKFSLAASLVKPEFKFKQLANFIGVEMDYFSVEYTVPPQFEKFIKFAEEVCGKERIKRFMKEGKPEDRPHVSIWGVNKNQSKFLTHDVLAEIQNSTKQFLRPFIPTKVSFWDEFEISRIEQLETSIKGKSFKEQVTTKYQLH